MARVQGGETAAGKELFDREREKSRMFREWDSTPRELQQKAIKLLLDEYIASHRKPDTADRSKTLPIEDYLDGLSYHQETRILACDFGPYMAEICNRDDFEWIRLHMDAVKRVLEIQKAEQENR